MRGSYARKNVPDEFLSNFERTEVEEYEDVFFLAPTSAKYQATKLERLVNNGFDDNEGYYRFNKGDQIAYRYEVQEVIGKGAFGSVIRCVDHKTRDSVAIKIVKNQKKYYYQAAVEAKLLLLLKENDPDNMERVIKLNDYFVWRNHLCLVFELYSINLYEFIKMYDYQGFDYGLIRRFAIQLLAGLKYLKAIGIIHCDLKPENILMK
jgi:dual specificity tyrosine-phosphorylation-regulated kinase 2/3/4